MTQALCDFREIIEAAKVRNADIARQRSAFIDKPPPCAAIVSYSPSNLDGTDHGAEFLFCAADVEAIAEKSAQKYPTFEGMNGAVRWTSLRDESITQPTPVPELLVNFDYIAEQLIDAGMGQVRCSDCDKIYLATDLTRKVSDPAFASGWLYVNFLCPSRHSLLRRKAIHVMRKRTSE